MDGFSYFLVGCDGWIQLGLWSFSVKTSRTHLLTSVYLRLSSITTIWFKLLLLSFIVFSLMSAETNYDKLRETAIKEFFPITFSSDIGGGLYKGNICGPTFCRIYQFFAASFLEQPTYHELVLASPYTGELARLRMQRLRMEEEHLLELKRVEELERIRGPKPKWFV